jgi:hypothetical protein
MRLEMTDKMQSEINRGENTREREIAGKKGKESFELDRLGRGEIATNTLDRENSDSDGRVERSTHSPPRRECPRQ